MKKVSITKKFKYTVLATDVIIFSIVDNKLKVLLMKMTKEPFLEHWAVPGGLVDSLETVDQAAQRLLATRAGINNVYLEQLYTFGSIDRDPFGRVVSVAYFALLPKDLVNKISDDLQWFDVNNLPKLAYDHKEMIAYADERLKAKLGYTNIVYSLLKDTFTLTELQKVYEIILGEQMDKRNFRRKINQLDILQKAPKKKLVGAHRPAQLYAFKDKSFKIIDIL